MAAWNNYSRLSSPTYTHRLQYPPCSLRIETHTLIFSKEEGVDVFLAEAYGAPQICDNVQRWCTGPNAQFRDRAECVTYLDALPAHSPTECAGSSVAYALQGNTSTCRFLHHFMAKTDPQVPLHDATMHQLVASSTHGWGSPQTRKRLHALMATRSAECAVLFQHAGSLLSRRERVGPRRQWKVQMQSC